MEQQNNQNQRPSLPIIDLLFGLLDRLFKDNATGKVLASRVATIVILFILALIWVKGESLMTIYKEASFENYSRIVQKDKDQKFVTTSLEQLQIVHVSADADFSAVYSFRPRNLNYFVDLVAYEGRLPVTVNEQNLGGFPIDKTSNEYSTHLGGVVFESRTEFVFLPTKMKETGLKYMYSCPYFNLDNVYSGTVAMYWYQEPVLDKDKLKLICGTAARTLGRAK